MQTNNPRRSKTRSKLVESRARQTALRAMKPEGKEDWLTASELSRLVDRNKDWLKILEDRGVIAKPMMVSSRMANNAKLRLYSPEEVVIIKKLFDDIDKIPGNYRAKSRKVSEIYQRRIDAQNSDG